MHEEDFSKIMIKSNIIQKEIYIDYNHGYKYLPLDLLPPEYKRPDTKNHRSKEQDKQFNIYPFYAKKIVDEFPTD